MSSEIRCCSYCGKIDYSGQKTECPFCHKSAMLKIGYTQEWYDNIRSQMGEDAPDRIILKRIVKSNPNFNEKLYKRRTKCDYNVVQITGHKKKHETTLHQPPTTPTLSFLPTSIPPQPPNAPRCPTCGSTDLKKIDALDRAISVSFLGLASGKIGKSFKCNHCGYMW